MGKDKGKELSECEKNNSKCQRISLKLNVRGIRQLKRTAHEMVQQIKAPGPEHDNLNLIPQPHIE